MAENVPPDLLYTATHEWLKVEGIHVRVGITDHAQSELTDIVFVELPKIGKVVEAGKGAAVLESVKTIVDVISPISGAVTEVNEDLKKTPELLNKDPYGKGWIFVVEGSVPQGRFLSHDKYRSSLTSH